MSSTEDHPSPLYPLEDTLKTALTITNPYPTPKTLTSLPHELLIAIALHCDRPTASSLALVCRATLTPAQHRIWRDLDLFLPLHYGEYPQVQPLENNIGNTAMYWEIQNTNQTQLRYCRALRAKISRILELGEGPAGRRGPSIGNTDEKREAPRFSMVRAVRLTAQPSSSSRMMEVLQIVAPKLQSLDITAPLYHSFDSLFINGKVSRADRIDTKMMASPSTYPHLTHVRLGRMSIHNADFPHHVCVAAPALRYLLIETQIYVTPTSLAQLRERLAKPIGEMLERLDISLEYSIVEPDGRRSNLPMHSVRLYLDIVVAILKQSPRLHQLSIDTSLHYTNLDDQLNSVFGPCGPPWDLHWTISLKDFGISLAFLERRLSLRRLIVQSHLWADAFLNIPSLPNLETILLIPSPIPKSDLTSESDEVAQALAWPWNSEPSSETHPMPQFLDEQLRASPKLRSIHIIRSLTHEPSMDYFDMLDNLDKIADPALLVTSLRHPSDGDELLLVRCYRRCDGSDNGDPSAHLSSSCLGIGTAGQEWGLDRARPKVLMESVVFCDFKGETVPMEIIDRMCMAEGVGEEQWADRGTQVGDEAWRILAEWSDSRLAMR